MFDVKNFLSISKDCVLAKDQVAQLLKTDPQALEKFENIYHSMTDDVISENYFKINAKQAVQMNAKNAVELGTHLKSMISDIVAELKENTAIWKYDGNFVSVINPSGETKQRVSIEDINKLPEELKPDLTGYMMKKDIPGESYPLLFMYYKRMLDASNPKEKKFFYDHFRQGLDILDFDPIMYNVVGQNQNSMGYWLPLIIDDVLSEGFFKIPKTTIFKVPLPMLQLTRCDYMSLTRTTLSIVDNFVHDICELDDNKTYFIKTGTYSSKFDFRNAKVTNPKEVRELGEYLLFIHSQANQMASPLNNISIYGVSTTNDWVVREFIEDKENNPCIYNGMPLHTEYRVFVDFDSKEILGINPYWDSNVMKQKFSSSNDPQMVHDYIIYSMHEDVLMKRYEKNKDMVIDHIKKIIEQNEKISGQWSIDIMQNGDDFWLIDMACAANSALSFCVPKEKLKLNQENWVGTIPEKLYSFE